MPKLTFMFLLGALAGGALHARTLDLPIGLPGSAQFVAPGYWSNRIEIELRPAAATRARAARLDRGARVARLGVAGLDRLAAEWPGLSFEAEFWGEVPPAPGDPSRDFTAFYVAHLPDRVSLSEALDRLGALPEVVRADPIAVLPISLMPNDSLWSQSFWLYQPSIGRDIGATAAWDVTTGDTAIVVAVLDTGVLPYHPDLGGTVLGSPGQMWRNATEASGVPGVDDDANGFVDDIAGWDFVDGISQSGVPNAEDSAYQDNDPNDYAGHGTAVAGVLGAIADNTIGMTGLAWQLRIMPLRMGWATFAAPFGEVDMLMAARAIRYATRMGADIINCSFATLDQNGISAAVGAATDAGILVVFAAGNLQVHEIQERHDVIAVAATDRDDHIYSFSNLGRYVDVAAPGVNLISTFVDHAGADSIGVRKPSYRGGLQGTSFAAPLVSGALALVQADRKARGRAPLTPHQAILRVHETATDIASLNPGISGYGGGRLDVPRLLAVERGSNAFRLGPTRGAPIARRVKSGVGMGIHAGRNLVFTRGREAIEKTVALPSDALAHPAAADLGGGEGAGVFLALGNGMVAGFDLEGAPLPGWPVSSGSGRNFTSLGLGDLDGDGRLEIVAGAIDGITAWDVHGVQVPGLLSAGGGIQRPIALSNLDGMPGVEVIAVSTNGLVFAYNGSGSLLPGWPVFVEFEPRAPVIGRLGANATPGIVIASETMLRAFRGDGEVVFSTALPSRPSQDPVLADLDGDGVDEIVLLLSSPSEVAVYDSAGVTRSDLGWPRALSGLALGAPVVGQLRGDPEGALEILVQTDNGLVALTDRGQSLSHYPRPGIAGTDPTLAELDEAGTTLILAGAGADSILYFYDAGEGSAFGDSPWPTARANFARTGSSLYAPPLSALDDAAPAAVVDLAADSIGASGFGVTWSAPGDDGAIGRANAYELRIATHSIDATNFSGATLATGVPMPAPAGSAERAIVGSLEEGVTHFLALRTRDESGNVSDLSNVLVATTGDGAPGRVLDLAVGAASETTITLAWSATGDDGASGRPVFYRARASEAPITAANFDAAPHSLSLAATAMPGMQETLVFGGLAPARTFYLAVKAFDDEGRASRLSNVVASETRPGGPLTGRLGAAIASRTQPSRRPVELFWQAGGLGLGAEKRVLVLDLSGRRIRVLPVGAADSGLVQWNGRDEGGHLVPAGVYFARLTGGSFHAQTRVVLLP